MKRIGRKNMKIIAATAMTIFSLFACVSAVYAWFVAKLSEASDADQFNVVHISSMIDEIKFYKYLGTSTPETVDGQSCTYYGFDPTPIGSLVIDDEDVSGSAPSISLGTYSVTDPHHLLLILFKINDNNGAIRARTDFSYLANNAITPPSQTVASYSALMSVNTSGLSGGEVYEVTTDEEHGSIKTQYTFNVSLNKWEMNYELLQQNNNPLSSVVKVFTFTYTEVPAATNHNLYLYSNSQALPNNSTTQEIRDANATSTSCIALDTASFTDESAKSFVSINNNTANFTKEINLYENNNDDEINYVGLVFDYHSTSIEYISYHFLGHNYLSDGLQFKCDWETII